MYSIYGWSVQAGWRAASVQQRPGGKPSVATVTELRRKFLCIVTKATTVVGWGGREERMERGKSWRGEGKKERKRERLGRRSRVKITAWGERKERGWWVVVWGAEIWARFLLFLPSQPVYAGWFSTVWENLQFAVTSSQTKLLSRFFWLRWIQQRFFEKAAQTEHNKSRVG